MGYIKIWVHLVWSTKNRQPLLDADIRKQVFDHMRENAIDKDIYIDFINGYYEHVHCLISLSSGQNIDKIQMLLKGESSIGLIKINFLRRNLNGKMNILPYLLVNLR